MQAKRYEREVHAVCAIALSTTASVQFAQKE
ncbi:hypothetical protein LMG29542_08020 [Paraburkholderia humisilvae]|uniref:Uncharacterized protein n=1 Tax=Paraburkholderia humisilvae TaxID=627669 RepID=A0A6J5FAE0_9BURK|nr:hypothetical protein LMG29542_08020 [Paraburkholderia humisilvae]